MSRPAIKFPNQVMVRLDDELLAALSSYAESHESTVAATLRLAARRFLAEAGK